MPAHIQAQARVDYRQFLQDPNYPGLHFHAVVRGTDTLYSVYVGIHYRALATLENGDLHWFWIGHHAVYDKILAGHRWWMPSATTGLGTRCLVYIRVHRRPRASILSGLFARVHPSVFVFIHSH